MQFRLFPAIFVFLGSYLPLAIILAVRDITPETWQRGICNNLAHCVLPSFAHPVLSLVGVALTLVCLIFTAFVLNKVRYKYQVKIIELKSMPSELVGYSFPYIVSFMSISYGQNSGFAALLIFMFWLFLITYRSGTTIMNPVLLILGWNLYEAKVKINNHIRVIRILGKKQIVPATYLCQEIKGSYVTKGEVIDE